jgi:exopolysaccharide production protein ExoZ
MIWSIQVLRFVAALMVVYLHAEQATTFILSVGSVPHRVATIGHAGVDIFFVISGLIITKIAPGRTPSEFIWSRIIRIVPMYLLFTAPALVDIVINGFGWRDVTGNFSLLPHGPVPDQMTGFGWRNAIATFLFWPATDQITAPALVVGWTLCFEMLFYACAALVLVDRRYLTAIIGAFGIAVVIRSFGPPFQFLGNPIVLEFALGVIIAYLPSWRSGAWAIPLGAFWLFAFGLNGFVPTDDTVRLLSGDEGLQRVVHFGIPSALIVYGTLQINAGKSVWTYLGDASYSLYLSHTLIVPIAPLLSLRFPILSLRFPISPDLITLISILACVLFAWRVHELFEKPIMAWFGRSRFGPRSRRFLVAGGR